jgi:hypothetical protein
MNYEKGQYALWQILAIWLAAGAPMWLLGWAAYPAMSAGLPSVAAGLLRMKLLTAGLIWHFVLAMIILYREEGNIRLGTISRRFWLNHPVSASTGKTKKALWWWIIPLILLYAILEIAFRSSLIDVWLKIFPFFADPGGGNFEAVFATRVETIVALIHIGPPARYALAAAIEDYRGDFSHSMIRSLSKGWFHFSSSDYGGAYAEVKVEPNIMVQAIIDELILRTSGWPSSYFNAEITAQAL